MGATVGLCHICSSPTMTVCQMCGKPACGAHLDIRTHVCSSCAGLRGAN